MVMLRIFNQTTFFEFHKVCICWVLLTDIDKANYFKISKKLMKHYEHTEVSFLKHVIIVDNSMGPNHFAPIWQPMLAKLFSQQTVLAAHRKK